MTTEEFDLSERIAREVYEGELDTSPSVEEAGFEGYFEVVRVKDVKEFIKQLKEEIRKCWIKSVEDSPTRFYLGIIEKEIDKLAGARLK